MFLPANLMALCREPRRRGFARGSAFEPAHYQYPDPVALLAARTDGRSQPARTGSRRTAAGDAGQDSRISKWRALVNVRRTRPDRVHVSLWRTQQGPARCRPSSSVSCSTWTASRFPSGPSRTGGFNGKFPLIVDPEGHTIELREPKAGYRRQGAPGVQPRRSGRHRRPASRICCSSSSYSMPARSADSAKSSPYPSWGLGLASMTKTRPLASIRRSMRA